MVAPIISLRIAGTKQRQGGFAPLVSVGVLAGGEGENMDRITLVSEKPAYILKHAEEYILYGLIDRQVKSFDADAPGVLSIAVTIPSNMKLANNDSPYKLLREVYEKFQQTYMERMSDGRDSFLNADNDSELFRTIISQYSLEERQTVYYKMSPQGLTGIVCVSLNDMEEFFRNTQYREFSGFKDIEIGSNCHSMVSPGLEKLQIPLPAQTFNIRVNGKETREIIQLPSDSYTAQAPDGEFFSYAKVTFTLEELLNAPQHRLSKDGASITLDMRSSRIDCNLKRIDFYYDFVYEWDDQAGNAKDEILKLFHNANIKLMVGSQDITYTLFEQRNVRYIDIKDKRIDIIPKLVPNYNLYTITSFDHAKRQVKTKIVIKKRIIEKPIIPEKATSERPTKPFKTNPYTNNDTDYANSDLNINSGNKKFYIKVFSLGLVVGLILGICIGLLPTWLNGDKNTNNTGENTTNGVVEAARLKEEAEAARLKEEAEATRLKEEAEATRLKEAEARAREAEEKANAKKEILTLVNKKQLTQIRNYKNIKSILTANELSAIEAVLDMTKYKGTIKKKVENLLKDKDSFSNFEDIVQTQKEIWKIENEK